MMMRRVVFLLIAIAVSALAVFIGQNWMRAQVAARTGGAPAVEAVNPTIHVLVARTNIPAGTFLRAEAVRWQEWPEDGLADAFIVEGKSSPEALYGAVVKSGLMAGEPITAARLVHPGDRGFMAAVVTPGDRAVTVNVTPSTGLAGFVSPGDRVDLILSMVVQPEGKTGRARHVSETILRNIRVLGMDQRLVEDKNVTVPKTATLEVTPKEAEIVAVVSELGVLSLSLRSIATDRDADAPDVNTSTWDSEVVQGAPYESTSKPQRIIDVVRGSDVSAISMAPLNPTETKQP